MNKKFNAPIFDCLAPYESLGRDMDRIRTAQRAADRHYTSIPPRQQDSQLTDIIQFTEKLSEILGRRKLYYGQSFQNAANPLLWLPTRRLYRGGLMSAQSQPKYMQYDELRKMVGLGEGDNGGFVAYIPVGGQNRMIARYGELLQTKECYHGLIPKEILTTMSGYDARATNAVYMHNPSYDESAPKDQPYNDKLVKMRTNAIYVIPRQTSNGRVYDLYGEGRIENYGGLKCDPDGVYRHAMDSATDMGQLTLDSNSLFSGMAYHNGSPVYNEGNAKLLLTVGDSILQNIGLVYTPMDSSLFADLDKYREPGTGNLQDPDTITQSDERNNYIKRLREFFKYMRPYRFAGASKGHLPYSLIQR